MKISVWVPFSAPKAPSWEERRWPSCPRCCCCCWRWWCCWSWSWVRSRAFAQASTFRIASRTARLCGRGSTHCFKALITVLTSRGGQNDTFYLWPFRPGGRGMGCRDKYVTSWPQLWTASCPFWPHRFPHFGYIHLGGGAQILDRCRAFDLFASVDAQHLSDQKTR